MKKLRNVLSLILFVSALLALLALVQPAAPVSASRWVPPPAPAELFVPSPAPINLGDQIAIYAQLRDGKGNVLSNYPVNFSIDYDYAGQEKTDNNGVAAYVSNRKLQAGSHLIGVKFAGDHTWQPMVVDRTLVVRPAMVTVQTFPPLAGVTFNMDNRDFVSGPDGVAKIEINDIGKYTLSINTDKYSDPNMRIEFGRWETESFMPSRDVFVPITGPIQAGLNIYYKVGQTFVDLDGKTVDPKRISKITIKSLQGDVFSYPDGQPRWIPISRTARRANGLEVTQLQYSVMNITVDGSNVVNQAQQRFFAKPNDTWKIQLLLYNMQVSVQDALFGTPVGRVVRVEFPDGQTHTYRLDNVSTTEIRSLARGIYHIQVIGVKGMISPTPVALSRNQQAIIQVITDKDMEVVGAAGLVVVIGLLLIGRPWLLLPGMRRRRQKRAQVQAEQEELAAEAEGYASIHNN